MKKSLFTENRLLRLRAEDLPEPVRALVASNPEAQAALDAAIATPVAETRAEIQAAQQTPEKPKNFFNFPWEFMRTTKGRIARTVGGLVFAPWLAVEAAMFAARSTEVAAKKAVVPTAKFAGGRIGSIASTTGHEIANLAIQGLKLPFHAWNTGWNAMGGVAGAGVGAVNATAGATSWLARRITQPLAWAISWIPLVNSATGGLDNALKSTQSQFFDWSKNSMQFSKKGWGGVGEHLGQTWDNTKYTIGGLAALPTELAVDVVKGPYGGATKNTIEKARADFAQAQILPPMFAFGKESIVNVNGVPQQPFFTTASQSTIANPYKVIEKPKKQE